MTDDAMRESESRLPSLESALTHLNDQYVFVSNPVGILDVTNRVLLPRQQFLLIVENQYALDGRTQLKIGPAWLGWPQRCECNKVIYDPGVDSGLAIDGSCYNLWRGLAVEPRSGNIEPWSKLLDHIFTPDLPSRRYFEQWVAFPLQRPGIKLYTAVVFWGPDQGAGKSLAGEVIGSIYGDNFYELSPNDLLGQVNEWYVQRQFILINEIVSTGRRKEADHLKALITRQYATINRKYQPTYTVRDCVNYLITSNHPDAVQLDDGDRRFFVHKVNGRLDAQLAEEVGRWKDTAEGRAALLHHFLNVDLAGFNPRAAAPVTQAKRDMIEESRTDLQLFILDKITAAKKGEVETLVTVEQLRQEFDPLRRRKVTDRAFASALQKYGAVNIGQKRIPGQKDRARLWALTTTNDPSSNRQSLTLDSVAHAELDPISDDLATAYAASRQRRNIDRDHTTVNLETM
jgi:hypothetical protein